MKREINDSRELRDMADEWVNTLNFIKLEVLEKMSDNMLFEYIRQPEPDYDEFIMNYNLDSEYKEYLKENEMEDEPESMKEFCESEHENDFDNWVSERTGENYPMWNTCFEFKYEESEDVIKAVEEAGFGIIKGLEPFNTILFVSGAGYSFYGQHWIPLFINLPWNEDIKKQVEEKNIYYGNQ